MTVYTFVVSRPLWASLGRAHSVRALDLIRRAPALIERGGHPPASIGVTLMVNDSAGLLVCNSMSERERA